MALRKLKEKALEMRKQGMSYSQIKTVIKVSKSTLSLWLRHTPLSKKRIRELREDSHQRIERCRSTKAYKRNHRLNLVYQKVINDIGDLKKLTKEKYCCADYFYIGERDRRLIHMVSSLQIQILL